MTGIRDCCETSFMKTFSCRLNGSWKKGSRNNKPNYKKNIAICFKRLQICLSMRPFVFSECAVYTFFSCFKCLFLFHSVWCQFPQLTVWILIAFWCVFPFVVYKVRDTTVQKLNQGWKRKQRGRGRDEGRSYHPRFSFHAVVSSSYFVNYKTKTHQKINK